MYILKITVKQAIPTFSLKLRKYNVKKNAKLIVVNLDLTIKHNTQIWKRWPPLHGRSDRSMGWAMTGRWERITF